MEQWLDGDVTMRAAEILRRLMALAPAQGVDAGQQALLEPLERFGNGETIAVDDRAVLTPCDAVLQGHSGRSCAGED